MPISRIIDFAIRRDRLNSAPIEAFFVETERLIVLSRMPLDPSPSQPMPTSPDASPADNKLPSDLQVSWDDYHRKIEQLALDIHRSKWTFDVIVCIARGGLRVGDILSRIYDKPLAILSVRSYGGDVGRDRLGVTLSQTLSTTVARLGPHVLLVDDLVDSGNTLQRSIQWLRNNHGQDVEMIKTATLWRKPTSAVTPDYCVEQVEGDRWICQPFEQYEQYPLPP
ncbi:MAG: phosphoribosyltransferase [Cyanophyceae cyanobacterium]